MITIIGNIIDELLNDGDSCDDVVNKLGLTEYEQGYFPQLCDWN